MGAPPRGLPDSWIPRAHSALPTYDSPGAGMSGAGSVRSLSPSTTAFPTTLLGPHIQHATKAEPAELGIKREAPGGN